MLKLFSKNFVYDVVLKPTPQRNGPINSNNSKINNCGDIIINLIDVENDHNQTALKISYRKML